MSLSKASVQAQISWTQQSSTSGFVKTQQGPDKVLKSTPVAIAALNEIYVYKGTLAVSGTLTIDLRAVTNLLNESVVFTGVQKLFLSTSATNITMTPGASNGLVWFYTGTSPVLTIKSGGAVTLDDGAVTVVDATHKTLTITNLSSTATTYIELAIIGTSI